MHRRLVPYSDYIGLFGLVGVLSALGAYLLRRSLDLRVEVPLVLGALLLGLFVYLRPQDIQKALTGRQARYGSNVLVMAIALVGILGLLNFLGTRHVRRIDLTETRDFSLSAQTLKILDNLDKPVKITGFYENAAEGAGRVKDLLKEYARHSPKITYEFIDPDRQPALARQYKITSYGTLVFESGGTTHSTYGSDEQDITAGVLKVARPEQKKIYFLTGHGERSISEAGQNGFSSVKDALEKENYQVAELNLAVTSTVPSDIAALVIAAPKTPLLDDEKKRFTDYLDNGGKVLLLEDPGSPSLFNDLLARYGISFDDDIVVDPGSSLVNNIASLVISRYRWHQITKDLPMSLFPGARSVRQGKEAPRDYSVDASVLAETTQAGWGETDLQSRQANLDKDKDIAGPVPVAMVAEVGSKALSANEDKARLVIFGSSAFAANSAFNVASFGNRDLFLNSVNWLTQEEALINIRSKPPTDRTMILTAQRFLLIALSTIVLLPLAVLAVGVSVWWKRR